MLTLTGVNGGRFFWALPGVGLGLVLWSVYRAAASYCFHFYDLGIYAEALTRIGLRDPNPWVNGRQLYIFNDHFDPVLFLAAPIAQRMSPVTGALVVEWLFVVAAALPLVWAARRDLLTSSQAAFALTLIWLSPSVVAALRFPVHPTTWAVAPMIWLGVGYLAKSRWQMVLALLLLFACKEEFPFVGVMLTVALLLERERSSAMVVGGVTLAWLAMAFVLRPWLLGDTESYASSLFVGLGDDPLGYLRARFNKRAFSRLGSTLVVLVPLLWLAFRHARSRLVTPLLLILLPIVGVRFLGIAWRHHYGAPLAAALVCVLLPALAKLTVPRWVWVVTFGIVLVTNGRALKAIGRPTKAWCTPTEARLAAIDRAVAITRDLPSDARVLVEGNLYPPLIGRDTMFVMGGVQKEHRYDYLLVENSPGGAPYPLTQSEKAEVVSRARQAATRVIVDDAYIFLAEGDFEMDAPE